MNPTDFFLSSLNGSFLVSQSCENSTGDHNTPLVLPLCCLMFLWHQVTVPYSVNINSSGRCKLWSYALAVTGGQISILFQYVRLHIYFFFYSFLAYKSYIPTLLYYIKITYLTFLVCKNGMSILFLFLYVETSWVLFAWKTAKNFFFVVWNKDIRRNVKG